MNPKYKSQLFKRYLLPCAVLLCTLSSCNEEYLVVKSEGAPDYDKLGKNFAMLRDAKESERSIVLNLEDSVANSSIYVELNSPADETLSFSVKPAADLISSYNSQHKTNYALFPLEAVKIDKEGKVSIDKGEKQSAIINISFEQGAIATDSTYLLPLKLQKTTSNTNLANEYEQLFYLLQVPADKPIVTPRTFDFKVIAGMDVGLNNPLNFSTERIYLENRRVAPGKRFAHFDIVNLGVSNIALNSASQLPVLELSHDMRHVLTHRGKYIRPLQDEGIKVCLEIMGSKEGFGFCNLNEAQIKDFVFQVKSTMERYQLDGINLNDEGSDYGAAGVPKGEENSYPRLIKALREALPNKLITLVDFGEPTAEFHQVHNGIEVGKLIDYAWHGYYGYIFSPWQTDERRKPIAGMEKNRYGGLSYDTSATSPFDSDEKFDWNIALEEAKIVVAEGLRVFSYCKYPFATNMTIGGISNFFSTYRFSGAFPQRRWYMLLGDRFMIDGVDYLMYPKDWE